MLLGNYLTGVVALFAESGASQWRRLINLLLSTEQRYADFTRSLSSSLKKLAFLFFSLFLSLSCVPRVLQRRTISRSLSIMFLNRTSLVEYDVDDV